MSGELLNVLLMILNVLCGALLTWVLRSITELRREVSDVRVLVAHIQGRLGAGWDGAERRGER